MSVNLISDVYPVFHASKLMWSLYSGKISDQYPFPKDNRKVFESKASSTTIAAWHTLRGDSKLNCQLTSGSVWFGPVCIVMNIDDHPEPESTSSQSSSWVLKLPLNCQNLPAWRLLLPKMFWIISIWPFVTIALPDIYKRTLCLQNIFLSYRKSCFTTLWDSDYS